MSLKGVLTPLFVHYPALFCSYPPPITGVQCRKNGYLNGYLTSTFRFDEPVFAGYLNGHLSGYLTLGASLTSWPKNRRKNARSVLFESLLKALRTPAGETAGQEVRMPGRRPETARISPAHTQRLNTVRQGRKRGQNAAKIIFVASRKRSDWLCPSSCKSSRPDTKKAAGSRPFNPIPAAM